MKLKNKMLTKIKQMNKKELIILSVLFICLLSIYIVPIALLKKEESLPEVKLREMKKNKMFALMIPDDKNEGKYKEYTGSDLFPKGYLLNIDKSYCLDNSGQNVEGALSRTGNSVTVKSDKTIYCTLYFEHSEALVLIYDNTIKQKTGCETVQCALDELYSVSYY